MLVALGEEGEPEAHHHAPLLLPPPQEQQAAQSNDVFVLLAAGGRWRRVLRVDAPTKRGQTALSYASWKG